MRDIQKRESEFRKAAGDVHKLNPKQINKKKFLSKGKYPELEAALNTWFLQARLRNEPVSTACAMAKAQLYAERLGIDIMGSKGYIRNWCRRHGLHLRSLQGEMASADYQANDAYVASFPSENKDLTPQQMFNADETGIFINNLPRKSIVSITQSRLPGHKSSKKRFTILACNNASGKSIYFLYNSSLAILFIHYMFLPFICSVITLFIQVYFFVT